MEIQIKTELEQRYLQVKNRIHSLAQTRQPPIELLAVSKGQPAAKLRHLYAIGQKSFGENYLQELISKAESLQDLSIDWVYIGQLQTNKIRKIVAIANEIQTVGTIKQAVLVDRYAHEIGKAAYPIWIEVKTADSVTKHGCSKADLNSLVAAIADLPNLYLKGIMAIPPAEYQDDLNPIVPPLYYQLRQLASTVGAGQLSLGMSGDLRLAVEAGSNLVRIGTALFGSRLS